MNHRPTFFCYVCITGFWLCVYCADADGQIAPGAGPVRIVSISIKGNVRVETSRVLSRLRSRAGEPFDAAVAAEDAKRIAKLEAVEYSYYNTKPVEGGLELTFVVAEREVIRSIEFVGNKAYSSKKLLKKLGFKVGDFLDPVLAETYSSTISEFYHKKGYAFAGVSLDRSQLSSGKVIYKIAEGHRVKIASVKFSGNSRLKTGALKKVIKSRTRRWLLFPKYYIEEQVAADVAKLQRAYQKKGFLNSKVQAERRYNADKSRVHIIFDIEEGSVYTVEDIVFMGNKQFDRQALLSELKLRQGEIYSEPTAELDVRSLLKLYRRSGFIDADIEQGIRFVSEKSVSVEFTIKEGQRFRIGRVIITGNEQTQDRVVRRILDEYDFQPGRWYNADIARGDGRGMLEKRLQRMLLTEREGATISPEGDVPGQKDARVGLTEGKTGMVMLGAGVTSDSGVIGQLMFEQRNFDIHDKPKSLMDFITGNAYKGAGQSLRISLAPGTELSEYSVTFSEPYLNDKPIGLDLSGSSWMRWRESYDERRAKGYIGLEKRYKNKWRRSIGFRAENVSVDNLDSDAPQEIIDVEGDNFIAGVRLGIGRELIDDVYNPSSGHSFNLSYEQVGGDYTFGIISGVYRRYKTLYEDLAERKTVFSTKLLAATVVGSAPPFEKFYAGGTGTYGIRGFEYRGVSTRGLQTNVAGPNVPERKDPIGSDWIFLAGAEVTVPLMSNNISWLIFADSGAIDSGGYRAAAGTGVQILIPQWFGPVPMRFELSAPLLKESQDDTQVFSFSVGRLF